MSYHDQNKYSIALFTIG